MNVLIKNVSKESWKKFKIEAIKRNEKLGDLFSEVANKIESAEGNWNKIKNCKASISDKETKILKKEVKEFREKFEFRY